MSAYDDHAELVRISEAVSFLRGEVASLRDSYSIINKELVEAHVKNEQLEKRLVQHSARHESNYREVRDEVKELRELFVSFSSKLDKMMGRDSVLKVLFGAVTTATIVFIVNLALSN